ncbi:MAG TPA: hypothetical protein VF581_01105 [Flavobacterium sp.]|jgi:hypothetical protein
MIANKNLESLRETNFHKLDFTQFQKHYLVELLFEEDVNTRTRITHDVFVKTIDKLNNDLYVISVVQWNFLVNNAKPDLIFEQLAEKCHRPLENLVYYVNKDWQVVGIQNHNEIVNKWRIQREKMEQEYTGEIFTKYIDMHEAVIINYEVLLHKLKQATFTSQFFYPVYKASSVGQVINQKEVVNFLNINYEFDLDLYTSLKELAEKREIIIIDKKINDEENRNLQMPVDEYHVKYELANDLTINNVVGIFKNHHRKLTFTIVEKSDIEA